MPTTIKINRIPLFQSFLFFVLAGLLFLLLERAALPYLAKLGVHKAILFLLMAVPHIIFFITALAGYHKEGNPWKWKALKTRFRYKPIKGKMILWTLVIIPVYIVLYLAVYELAFPLVEKIHNAFPPPDILNKIMNNGETFAGFTVKGNWALIPLYGFLYFFNVVGEEFLWRGYLFPRQELQHGKYTWLVHGLLWTMFHLFAPYNALLVLPGALFMSYVVQRTQNNTLFLIAHAVLNGIPLVMLVMNIIT